MAFCRFSPHRPAMAPSRRTDLALLVVILIWGTNFPVIKVALDAAPAFVVNLLRFLVSAVVLGALAAWESRGEMEVLLGAVRRYWRQIVLLGLLAYGFYQVLFILGVSMTRAGSSALLISSAPIWTALIARVLGFERLPLGAWVGLALAFSGTALVILGGPAGLEGDTLEGNLLSLAAAVMWALYTVLSRPVMEAGVPATGLAFFGVLAGLPVLIGLALFEIGDVVWADMGLNVWGAILFSGALSTGLAYSLWNIGVRSVGASQAAIYNNLTPAVALVVGYFLIGEEIKAFQVLGGTLILGGLLLMRRARQRTRVMT